MGLSYFLAVIFSISSTILLLATNDVISLVFLPGNK